MVDNFQDIVNKPSHSKEQEGRMTKMSEGCCLKDKSKCAIQRNCCKNAIKYAKNMSG
jgi:hypothetical protein